MDRILDVARQLTQVVDFKHAEAVSNFIKRNLNGAQKFELEPIEERFRFHAPQGAWTVWSKLIGAQLIVFCEAPGGIIHDLAISLEEKRTRRNGYIPPDCGHKVPARHLDFDDGRLPPTEPLD